MGAYGYVATRTMQASTVGSYSAKRPALGALLDDARERRIGFRAANAPAVARAGHGCVAFAAALSVQLTPRRSAR